MVNLTEVQKGQDYKFVSTDRHCYQSSRPPTVSVEGIVATKHKKLYKLSAKAHTILADSDSYGTVWHLER